MIAEQSDVLAAVEAPGVAVISEETAGLPRAAEAPAVGDARASVWSELRETLAGAAQWPLALKLFALGTVALYVPVIAETAHVWMTQDAHAHGVFILPVALLLAWLLRHDLRSARRRPSAWGLLPLAIGLLMETASYLLRLKFFPIISLVPVLAGGILLFYGRDTWRLLCFPVLFLVFAAPLPDAVLLPASAHVQRLSTDGAAATMRLLGYPLIQTGNRIDTPQVSVEVAEVCSGFKKLTAMVAFAFLYGFVLVASPFKRGLLVLSAYPISLAANVVRICALIAIGSAGGIHALEAAHDWAEIGVLIVAFFLFTTFGKLIGCRTLRFQPSSG